MKRASHKAAARPAAPAAKRPVKPAAETLAAALADKAVSCSRLGRLLHDEVGPLLSAGGLQLDLLRMDVHPLSPELAERAAMIQQLLERAMSHVRDLSRELNAGMVTQTGLKFAMESLVERTRASFAGQVSFHWDTPLRVPVEIGSVLYDIAERALANAVKHAAASQIDVSLRGSSHLTLQVQDDGKGFNVDRARRRSGAGMLMMEAIASRAGLNFSVKSAAGRGTIVTTSYRSPKQG